jgi:hypothetical protein
MVRSSPSSARLSIRQHTDTTAKIKQAIEDSLGIPFSHVIVAWDHTHYSDCGEALEGNCVAAVRAARDAARPAKMGWKRVSMGPAQLLPSGQSPPA